MKQSSLSLAVLLAFTLGADAWIRMHYEDATIVDRSELIVVGHLKEKSIEYVPRDSTQGKGSSWEHHASLVVTGIIKGKAAEKEIPIIIHYGLEPVVGGYVKHDGFMMDRRGTKKQFPPNLVQIYDIALDGALIVEDASKDNIWFLGHLNSVYGREPGGKLLGIVDPEDVQPLPLKEYFETYLQKNPEEAVKSYAVKHPEVSKRAQGYLNHLEVQRILKIEDPAVRFDRLLPHYLNHESWELTGETKYGIISCGDAGGKRLVSIFQDPAHKDFREDIISIWRDMYYSEAAPLLIQLLKEHDGFWAEQKLEGDWWNVDYRSALTKKRQDIYGEDYHILGALRRFRDPRSREVLELVRSRWKSIKMDNNPQMLEECEAALKELQR